MNYKVIITGTTGMVGEGVLIECLTHPQISEVLSVSRRPTGMSHPKLKEYLVPDFLSLQAGDESERQRQRIVCHLGQPEGTDPTSVSGVSERGRDDETSHGTG